jgi:methenyltetrahydrofolate cyclohydrolase
LPAASKRSATTERLSHLLEELASSKPAPAGGSAAAAVIAVAAALLEKVALLSVKQWDGARAAKTRANRLRLRSEELIEEDVEAYVAYLAAVRSGRHLADARAATIDVPLDMVRRAVEVLDLAHELARFGNRNLRPDATTAAILAHASISAAAMIIQVNVGLQVRDPRLEEALRLMRGASASVRRLGARSPEDGPDRAPARSRGIRRP